MANLIFGCGYLGLRVADRWLADGKTVHAVTRSPARAKFLADRGISPIVADVTKPKSLKGLPLCDAVLFAIGYDRSSGAAINDVYVGGLGHVLESLPARTGRLIYVSSTGVYGHFRGGWVDEESPCEPTRAGGEACLAAERLLQAHSIGSRSVVLRLAGIYGPGRIPWLSSLKAGEPISAPSEGFLNLIHVEDGATVIEAAETTEALPKVYCVCDGHPVERAVYYQAVAEMVGAPPPRFVAAKSDSHAAKRAASDKRVRNSRMLDELRVVLRFPNYRDGLADAITASATALR